MSVAVALAGCKKDFLDINQDPNRVTDDNVTAELIFPAAAEAVGATTVGARANGAGAKTSMQFAQDWVGYMAANGDFARDETETTYNIDFTFADNMFQTRYGLLFDLHQATVKGLANDDTAVAAASMILSAKMFQELVDMFGNIPYSQAFNVKQTTRPAYDNAADIYHSLQLTLDTAIEYFGHAISSKFVSADIVNHGDADLWIKLANTLKLRLLIRQTQVSGFDPSSEIAKIFGASSLGILEAGESVGVNPGYSNEQFKQSPFFANYGYTATGAKATSSTNANEYIITILKANSDPRIERFFQPVGGNFVGCTYGDANINIPLGANASYFGPGLIGEPNVDGTFTAGAAQPQWIMPSYESLFFKAEAAARGWIGDDPATVYAAAVTESFVWLGVPDPENEATNYMSINASADYANSGGTPDAKAKFIAFQKYIANVGIDPLESWSDQRRLNFLPPGFMSVNPNSTKTTLPLRLAYPLSEYTTNGDNVNAQGQIDIYASKLFWEP